MRQATQSDAPRLPRDEPALLTRGLRLWANCGHFSLIASRSLPLAAFCSFILLLASCFLFLLLLLRASSIPARFAFLSVRSLWITSGIASHPSLLAHFL